jgi:hypothetical protein
MTFCEHDGRLAKAHAIADALQFRGVDSEEAPWLPETGWEAFAALAGRPVPSRECRELVVEVLGEREERQRQFAAMTDRLVVGA